MTLAILSAPSNLGLRPPRSSAVPGTCRAPEALREAGLHAALLQRGAYDAGVVLPGRYLDDKVPGTQRVRNQEAILDHARRLAARLDRIHTADARPLVLGGDCSILLGTALHLRRRGRFGLLHIDGHTDFRHPGNAADCASLAGEDLAAVVGRHWPAVSDIDGLGPYFAPGDVVHLGCRDDDEELGEVRDCIAEVIPATDWIRRPAAAKRAISRVLAREELDGYVVHVDVDVLDPVHLSAVDSPDPGGLAPEQLVELLRHVWPGCAALQLTIFDPDLDPHGEAARLLVEILLRGLTPPDVTPAPGA